LNCVVYEKHILLIKSISSILSVDGPDPTRHWFHWIIRNVFNPADYEPGYNFILSYQNAKNSTLWYFNNELMYFISQTNRLMAISDIEVSNLNLHT